MTDGWLIIWSASSSFSTCSRWQADPANTDDEYRCDLLLENELTLRDIGYSMLYLTNWTYTWALFLHGSTEAAEPHFAVHPFPLFSKALPPNADKGAKASHVGLDTLAIHPYRLYLASIPLHFMHAEISVLDHLPNEQTASMCC